MLTVKYTPSGVHVGDHEVMATAENIAMHAKYNKAYEFRTSSLLLVQAIRVLIKRGVLDYQRVEFIYESELITVNKEGRLDHWPKGFCDLDEILLDELIDWNV